MQTQWDKTILFFDGDCGFCNTWVNFILKWDKKEVFYFSSLHSELGLKMRQDFNISLEVDSIVLIKNGKSSIKSSAVVSICKLLGYPVKILSVIGFFPSSVSNWGYDLVGKYRHNMFKKTTCSLNSNSSHRFLG